MKLDTIITGTYNRPGNYKIVYKVNGTGDYRTLADNLSTSKNYTLVASPAALGLASNEKVTEVMFVFGQVPGGFAQVEAPAILCKANNGLTPGSSFANVADVGGTYNGVWVQAVTRWVTTVYASPLRCPAPVIKIPLLEMRLNLRRIFRPFSHTQYEIEMPERRDILWAISRQSAAARKSV